MTTNLVETTIRDFGGGWNVSDSDKSLKSKFQTISDNVVRQTDGSFSIRPGTKLHADLKQGVETVVTAASLSVTTVAGSGAVKITKTAHGYTSGQHINITAWGATIGTITSADILGNHGIVVVDANNFNVYVRKAGVTAAGPTAITMTYTHDTHDIGGRDIFGRYYKDNLYVFTDTGEILAVDINGTVTKVWNYQKAAAISQAPWGPCKRISAEIVRGHLLCVNGALNDKPLDINGLVANYLVDASTLSNAAVPRADFIVAADKYVLLIGTEYGSTKIEISAKNTTGTFTRQVAPADSCEIDLGMVTQSIDTTILGANVIRSRVFIGFNDRSQLGTLGTYIKVGTNDVHEPDFKDNVAQFGTFSHPSIISLGNDLLCAGLNGVNSLEISKGSGEYMPTTLSDFVHPVMLRHFSRLTEEDRRYRTFAVWDVNYRSYVMFAPKYSDITYTLPQDAVIVSSTLQPEKICFLLFPSHAVDAGDYIDIAGVTASPDGQIQPSGINGRRKIRAVYDDNTIVVEVDSYFANLNYGFGGTNITVKPVNDETPAYVYEYNPRLKISRWTRFRGMDFDWGCISQLNKLYFGKNGRIYRMGNNSDKYSGDKIGDYNYKTWATSKAYVVGDRVNDATVRQVYICRVAHTSPASGTFKQYRDNPANIGTWEEFEGYPITWEMESAWTDFGDRKSNKQVEIVSFDTEGSSEFEFSMYTNTIRTDFESFALIPNRTTIFIGQDAPGFGAGMQPWGGGRNTRQEWLRGMPVYGKLFRLRFAGSSTDPLQINAVTMYYHKSKVLT